MVDGDGGGSGEAAARADAVAGALAAGTTAWPGVLVTGAQLGDHVRALRVEAIQSHGADLYLAAACSRGDRAAVQHFETAILPAARAAIRSIDGNDGFVDEACQRVRESLLVGTQPKIATYAGRGPLRAWVGVSGARQALMLKRSAQRSKETPSDDEWTTAITAVSAQNPELDLLKRQHAADFAAALRDAAARLEPRLRACLRMHFVDGLSIDEIGAAYAVHRATAARWVSRARDELFTGTRALLVERLALSPTELDRLAMLVQSQIDLSLSQLLPPTGPG